MGPSITLTLGSWTVESSPGAHCGCLAAAFHLRQDGGHPSPKAPTVPPPESHLPSNPARLQPTAPNQSQMSGTGGFHTSQQGLHGSPPLAWQQSPLLTENPCPSSFLPSLLQNIHGGSSMPGAGLCVLSSVSPKSSLFPGQLSVPISFTEENPRTWNVLH